MVKKGKTMIEAIHKAICPACKGNGFIRVPYELAKEEVTMGGMSKCVIHREN